MQKTYVLTGTACVIVAVLAGCGTAPRQEAQPAPAPEPRVQRPAPAARTPVARAPAPAPAPMPSRSSRGGGYYLDDGPGDSPPADLESIPEPVPQLEPLHRGAMRPYVVLGQSFTPMTQLAPYRARGVATWYGRRYHGKQTSTGEIYDMYALSAAHPTLPLPSYVRVTNVATGKALIVRVNDRGPFLDNRLIDLSYTAAHRLGILAGGSALVDVELIIPDASSGTMFASAPARSAAVKPVPVTAGALPSAAEAADPILAIAAAARDVDPLATPEVPAPVAAALTAEAPAEPGVYLQLGAFGSRENAESYLARAKVQFEWLGERLHLRSRDGLFRVHAGPYGSAGDARQIAARIASSLGVKPVVVNREP